MNLNTENKTESNLQDINEKSLNFIKDIESENLEINFEKNYKINQLFTNKSKENISKDSNDKEKEIDVNTLLKN